MLEGSRGTSGIRGGQNSKVVKLAETAVVAGPSQGHYFCNFENFVKKAVNKKDARPFKVPKNIIMRVIDPISGEKASFRSKKKIIEAYKQENINYENYQFREINDRFKNNSILRFY